MFKKRWPKKGERFCPYDGVAYGRVPGYIVGYGCPVCKAIGNFHLPVLAEVANRYPRRKKQKV